MRRTCIGCIFGSGFTVLSILWQLSDDHSLKLQTNMVFYPVRKCFTGPVFWLSVFRVSTEADIPQEHQLLSQLLHFQSLAGTAADKDWVLGPFHAHTASLSGSSRILTAAWSSPHHCGHLGSELEDESSLLLSHFVCRSF